MVKTDLKRKKKSWAGENKEMKTEEKFCIHMQIFLYDDKFLASKLNCIISADNQKYIFMPK